MAGNSDQLYPPKLGAKAAHVTEGTWEEIERHKAELIGCHLRVTVTPQRPSPRKPSTLAAPQPAKAKELRGRGMFAGLLSTEKYFREKREDANTLAISASREMPAQLDPTAGPTRTGSADDSMAGPFPSAKN